MRSVFDRPIVLVGLALVCAVAAFHLWVTPSNPPATTATRRPSRSTRTRSRPTYATRTARFPLFFRLLDDYKSPLYPYVLAGVFEVTGPDARSQGALRGAGPRSRAAPRLLARRMTQSWLVAAVVLLAAGLPRGSSSSAGSRSRRRRSRSSSCSSSSGSSGTRRLELYDVRHGVGVGALVGAIAYSYTQPAARAAPGRRARRVRRKRALAVRHLRLDYLPRPCSSRWACTRLPRHHLTLRGDNDRQGRALASESRPPGDRELVP